MVVHVYSCDLCGKECETHHNITGLDFNIRELRPAYGYREVTHRVHEVCPECQERIMETVKSMYIHGDNITVL